MLNPKLNILRSAFMLMFIAVMVFATAVTAYADYDGEVNEDVYAETEQDPYEPDEPIYDPTEQEPLGSLIIINSTHDGQLLVGAVFALYHAADTERITEMTTDHTGRTMEIPLSQGNYNIVILFPAHGFAPIANVISTTITSGQQQELTIFSVPVQTQDPTPEPTATPVEHGRLLLTLRAQGTGQHLSGAVYELRRAMDNEFVTFLITDNFGEAAIDLSTGDYFLREIQAASGFIANPDRVNVRITANRLNEVNLTSRAEPIEEQNPPPQQETPPQPGRLIVTLRADGTREPIQGAVFEVRRAMDNRIVEELVTDRFGEAAVSLSPDDYFLRQLSAPQGFEFDTERINVRIAAGAIREVSVTNRRPTTTPPPIQTQPPQAADGRVLVTVIASDTGNRLESVVYTIHDVMTDDVITTITTNSFGEASALLPPGQYFMRNAVMVQGYVREVERVNFTIRPGAITNHTITARAVPQPTPEPTPAPVPTAPPAQTPSTASPSTPSATATPSRPTQSRVEITTRAELSGHPLHGATFTVYRAADNQRVGEVTTDMNGRATISLNAGEYYMRNNSVPYGFLTERSRIFFTVSQSNVSVEVTIQRDPDIPYVEIGIITLPQTGELTPVMNYVLGTLFMLFGLLCGAVLVYQYKQEQRWKNRHKRNRNLRKGAKAYA